MQKSRKKNIRIMLILWEKKARKKVQQRLFPVSFFESAIYLSKSRHTKIIFPRHFEKNKFVLYIFPRAHCEANPERGGCAKKKRNKKKLNFSVARSESKSRRRRAFTRKLFFGFSRSPQKKIDVKKKKRSGKNKSDSELKQKCYPRKKVSCFFNEFCKFKKYNIYFSPEG